MTMPGAGDGLGTIRDPQPAMRSSPAKVRRARRRYLRAVRKHRHRERWRGWWQHHVGWRISVLRYRLAERAYRLIAGYPPDGD